MKKYFPAAKKQFSTLALGCALVASAALTLINCTDPAPPTAFTVKFDTNGGEPAVKDKTVEAGKLLAKPATDPTKEGYSFVGWYKDQARTQAFNFSTEKITQNITLYAKWIETYTVTFDSNQGSKTDPQTIESGKKASKPNDPTKTDSTFAGWYKDQALTQAFDFNTETITANITLYAKWTTPNTYTVTFNSNEGSKTEPQTVESGKKASRPADPTKPGHSFLGWFSDQALTQAFDFNANTITQDITLYAKWESNLVDIPDANFRANLKALIPGAFVGEQLDAKSPEVTEREELNIRFSASFTLKIKSLEGIRYFTKLKRLDCSHNDLTALDLSKNAALTSLNCYNNILSTLDVSKNTALTTLNCAFNLNLGGRLDLSKNTALTSLDCRRTSLANLDIRGMRSVESLQIHYSPFSVERSVLDTLKVHENLKNHAQISTVKTDRGNKVTIEIYSAAEGSTAYTLLCSDYDPTVGNEADRCGDELKHTVVFNSRGGSLVDTLYLYYEGLISRPVTPIKTDSAFAGWYKDAGLTQAFDFNADNITQDTTLYARWASNKLTKANKHLLSRVDANGKTIITEGVVSIGEQAFYGDGLTAVALPNSLTTIGSRAFESNILTSVTLPNSLTEIGLQAFRYNELTSVNLPDSLTSIRGSAFADNELTSVIIPEGVNQIKAGTFESNNLTSVNLPDGLISINSSAFASNKLTSVALPDSLVGIITNAFASNKLTSVTLPNSVIFVQRGAFAYNPNLDTVTLSEKLYNAIDQRSSVSVNLGYGLEIFQQTGLDSTFGSQVTTYQTPDGTRLNEDATDASN